MQVLSRIRGTPHVEEELEDMAEAARVSNLAPHPMRNLFKAQYRPQLIISLMFMMFQQFTGINAIIFYAPVLFNSIGSGHTAALLNTVIIGAGEMLLMHAPALKFAVLFLCFIISSGLLLTLIMAFFLEMLMLHFGASIDFSSLWRGAVGNQMPCGLHHSRPAFAVATNSCGCC